MLLLFLSACGGVTLAGPTINSFTASSNTITISTDDTTLATPPVIVSFTASFTSISEGGNVTLIWVATGATTVYLKQVSGSGSSTGTVDLSSSTTVYPSETTTYTLAATNKIGLTPAFLTITVNPAVVVEQTIIIQPGPVEGKRQVNCKLY